MYMKLLGMNRNRNNLIKKYLNSSWYNSEGTVAKQTSLIKTRTTKIGAIGMRTCGATACNRAFVRLGRDALSSVADLLQPL